MKREGYQFHALRREEFYVRCRAAFRAAIWICTEGICVSRLVTEEWLAWREAFQPRLRQALGLDRMESDLQGYQPSAEMSQSEDMGTHIREWWHLWVEPTVPLPFYLLRPKTQNGPLPLVLTPHGHNHPHIYVGIAHSEDEEKSMLEGERDIARQAVEEGYLAIAPTVRAFGETRTEPDKENDKTSSCRIALMHGLLVGRTPIGERVWDISRLIDWALTYLNVAAQQIAITGNSGGGTVSLFAAACEPRISVAVPSSYFCTFEGSIGSIHHCDCNYVPGIMRLGEMYDVAGLIAPRPFSAIAGKTIPSFRLSTSNLPLNICSKSTQSLAYRKIANSISATGDTATIKTALGPLFVSISQQRL